MLKRVGLKSVKSIIRFERYYVPVQTKDGVFNHWIYLDRKEMRILTKEQWDNRRLAYRDEV